MQPKTFTGVWIPRHIIEDKDLSAVDKIIYAEIASFGECFMSNETLGERSGSSEASAKRSVAKLKEKGYIKQTKFDGRNRWLKASYDETGQNDQADSSNWSGQTAQNDPLDNNIENNKITTISKDIGASSLMKPKKTEYGNPEVNKLIETFVSLTGLRLMKMTEQRRYGSLLIKANGLDDCVGACAVVAASMEDQYAPRISDLKELYYKFGQLQVYARKKQGEQKKGQVQDLSEL